MTDHSWAGFWWTSITGAKTVISEVASALLDHRMVVLQIPADLPWRQQMRSCVFDAYYQQSANISSTTIYIDAADDNPEGLEPGKLILERLCTSAADRSGYRERSKTTIQEYLVQKGLLSNAIVWVKGLTGAAIDQWLKFLRGFSKGSALFVLECQGGGRIADSKAIHLVRYEDCITSYDLQLFNSFCLDNLTATYSGVWKQYIATAAALVCESDAEVSELLLRIINFQEQEIPEGLAIIANLPEYSRRGAAPDSAHVLGLYRQQQSDAIRHRIWSAQVQVLFPIIELERVNIIRRYEEDLQLALMRNEITQYGARVTDPMEIELGTLSYLISAREKGSDNYILYIPDEELRNRIRFLRECRNRLAHVNCCTPQQIAVLLG
ncbi:MAG: hypothetical protein IKK57_01375 [Clostridia bacterium]|nr:hypothetical protein [Clostridia bacterium]